MRNDRSTRSFLPARTFAERRTVGWTFLSVVWPINTTIAQVFPHQQLLVCGAFPAADLEHECPSYMEYWQVRHELQHGGER